MRILVIQNDPYTPAAMVGERIAARPGTIASLQLAALETDATPALSAVS